MATPDAGNSLSFTFEIPPDHPALAGHFPGDPVVPGVVVLDQVLSWLAWPAEMPRRLAWVKFSRALLAAQLAAATLTREPMGWRFTVCRGEQILVQGVLALPVPGLRSEP